VAPTLAIVGAGFMGSAHAANYASLGDRVRVKNVVGRSPERAAKVAETVGATVSDLDAVLADDEIDAVDICVPTPLHRDVAERAFAAGKNVFLEKPLALAIEDGEAILDAAERSGKLFMVGLVLRFWPEYVELHRLVERGELGTVHAVFAQRLSPPADWADWFADRDQTGGTTVDLLVHDFDQLNALLGTPLSVYASEPQEGHVHAVVDYEGGGSGIAEGSMAMPRSYPFTSDIRVLGSRGVAEYAFSATPIEGERNIGASSSARGLRVYPADGAPRLVDVESVDPWGPEIAEFVSCLESGRHPEQATGEQALWALKVSLAANRSLASGQAEQV
jgi:predicted dehydrogenase